MIRSSNKLNDNSFVTKVLQELDLSTTPVSGFHAEPDYWLQLGGCKRVIERYDWGVVLFLEDSPNKRAATVVCVGKFSPEKGQVMSEGKVENLPQAWYLDVAASLQHAAKENVNTIPQCLGFHEVSTPPEDVVCDGGMNSEGKAEPACAWRTRCIPFKAYCAEKSRLPSEVLVGQSPEQIIITVDHIVAGRTPPEQKVKPSAPEKRAAAAKPKAASKTPKADPVLDQLVKDHIEMAQKWCEGFPFTGGGPIDVMKPGTLYIMDRVATSRYSSLYLFTAGEPMQPDRHKKKAICSFRFKTSTGGFLVQLPVAADSPALKKLPPSDVTAWKDGAFQSAIKGVIKGQRQVDLVGEVIKGVIKEAGGVTKPAPAAKPTTAPAKVGAKSVAAKAK